MFTRRSFLMILALVAVVAVGAWQWSAAKSQRVSNLYGGPSAIDTILNATSVQAYRLPSSSYHMEKLADYTMSAGPIEIPAATVSKLRGVLMNDSVYLWDVAKACGEPDYGVRFQFQKGDDNIDVLICFKCNMLGIYHNGVALGYEDCDDGRSQLIEIAKELFPGDTAIQSLKMRF
jgi:hypothetical protein